MLSRDFLLAQHKATESYVSYERHTGKRQVSLITCTTSFKTVWIIRKLKKFWPDVQCSVLWLVPELQSEEPVQDKQEVCTSGDQQCAGKLIISLAGINLLFWSLSCLMSRCDLSLSLHLWCVQAYQIKHANRESCEMSSVSHGEFHSLSELMSGC